MHEWQLLRDAAMQREALEGALKQLWVLDALDIDGGITPLGHQMVSLPLDPSLARALIAATQLGCLPQATTVAAMLSAESIFQGNRSDQLALRAYAAAVCLWLLPCLHLVTHSLTVNNHFFWVAFSPPQLSAGTSISRHGLHVTFQGGSVLGKLLMH